MSRAILSLGANIGDSLESLRAAVEAIKLLPKTKVLCCSAVYKTAPVGGVEQEDFLNICLEIETLLSPQALLGACLGIEAAMGRVRKIRFGPRIIDIDIIVFEGETINTQELTLPHPRMHERAFVIVPMLDLIDDYNVYNIKPSELLQNVDNTGVSRLSLKI